MANPRQRRKLRSGSHKPVHHSRRAKKILKKQPPIRGPKVLQEAWDPHKTVRQNYEALGLAATLNPIASGGTERPLSAHAKHKEQSDAQPEASSSGSTQPPSKANGVPKGFGKIIRDADGNVVDVQLGDEDEEEHADAMDETLEDIPDPTEDDQLAEWVGLGSDPRKRPEESEMVQALEHLSEERGGRVPRHTSKGELATLRRLVGKYGEDVEAMARDRKLNPDQRTAGELKRAIRKAGGFAELGKAKGG